MNHDDPNSNLTPLNDPEIEARIVAWVMGEASAFEMAELRRIITEKPELGIFKRRIEAVHGLAGEAVRPDHAPLRLAEERRLKLLQAIGGDQAIASGIPAPRAIAVDFNARKHAQRKYRRWVAAVTTLAACAAIGFIALQSVPRFDKFREMDVKQKGAPVTAFMKREEASRIAEQDVKRRESDIPLGLPTVGDDATSRARYKQETSSKELARKDQIERLAQASAEKAAEMSARQFSRSSSSGKAIGPLVASPALTPPVAAFYGASPSQSKAASSFADTAQKLIEAGGKIAAADSSRNNPENQRDYYNSTSGTGNATASADGEPVTLSPFSITTSEDRGYSSSNTLAGSRVRTTLKDTPSAVAVVTKEFLADAGPSTNGQLLASTASTEIGGNLGNFSKHASEPARESLLLGVGSLPQQPAEPDSFRVNLAKTVDQLAANSPAGPGMNEKVADKKSDADFPLVSPAAKPAPIPAPVEVNASKEPVSTFSLHVSDVSFRLAQAAVAANETVDPSRIRPEEFYNAFSYGDPTPALAEKVSCRVEQSAHPFLQQRNLVRITLKVAASGRDAAQPLHLTVLLDHSGSMEREDRMATVKRAMESLVSLLGPNDRITLIGFARQPSLLAESVTGDQSAQLLDIIARTPAEGGTNLEEALKLGSELARRQFESAAQNRIVLLTDGAANLGNANPEQLATAIETLRQQGIAFDACGVGLEGLDDAMLENLTRKGDGRYYVLNSPEAADAGFAHQLAGAFRPAAENVKLQVRFNPARVGNYRLIGFEQHRLREEDFRNDAVDAAELAAEESAVAVYQVETLPQGEGELGEVYVRFRETASGNMVERSWTLSYDPQSPAFDRATPSMQLAGTAALLAEKLRGGQNADAIRLGDLAPVVNKLRSHYANEARVQDLATMYEQARRRFGE